MIRPVGPQRPAVYWRRRVVFFVSIALVLLLLVVVVRAVSAGGAGTPAAAATSSSAPAAARPASTSQPRPAESAARSRTAQPSRATSTEPPTAASGASSSGSATATASTSAPRPCTAGDLRIAAQTQQASFPAGSKPVLGLLVTDVGPRPCVQDFSDAQVLLRVYNGEARVWGSHDCNVQSGSQLRTLAVGRPVRVEMVWSGLSSEPGCGGTRQRVGAGAYTLYASLSGRDGTAATFTLS